MLLLLYIIPWFFYIKMSSNWQKTPLYSFLLYFYFAGMCSAFILYQFTPYYLNNSTNVLSLEAIVYHVLYLIIFFYPLKKLEERAVPDKLYKINYKILKLFLWILIILSLISIYSSIMILKDISNMSIQEIRTETLLEGTGREIKQSGNILSHISAFASEYSYISLFLAFYCMSAYPKKKITIWLLLISCFSYLFYNLEIGGREAIIRYLFDFLFVYIIFHNIISLKWKSKIKIILGIIIIILSIIMLVISLERFVLLDNDNFIYGTVGYFSQGFIYFSKFFETYKNTNLFGQNIFDAIIPGKVTKTIFDIDTQVPFDTNVFSTFVGSIVSDMGWYRALIPLGIAVLIMNMISKTDNKTIFYYIYMFWFMRFTFSGIFYWIDSFRVHARLFYFLLFFMIHLMYNLLHTRKAYINVHQR